MSNKIIQDGLITEAVKEQLGIEEDDYYDFEDEYVDQLKSQSAELKTLRYQMIELKEELVLKDEYIHKLEYLIKSEVRRVDLLEKKFYEFKSTLS